MCGISGFNGTDENLIRDMNRVLKHRGPDDDGIYVDKAVSLGHVRLSIIDLSEKGHQPLSDSNKKYYIVYNGAVYNFEEIRAELERLRYHFNSKTDTEVVLYSFIEWGEKCLESFNDMLAPLKSGGFLPLLAMEYLPGTYYSVDVLSWEGKPYYVVPKIRIQGSASNTTVGQVDPNPDAIDLVTKICATFKFSYLQNYEMKLNKDRKPRVYDINPLGGASIALCAAAGANIAYYAVKIAVGEEIPLTQVKDKVKMIRFYDEYHTDTIKQTNFIRYKDEGLCPI